MCVVEFGVFFKRLDLLERIEISCLSIAYFVFWFALEACRNQKKFIRTPLDRIQVSPILIPRLPTREEFQLFSRDLLYM